MGRGTNHVHAWTSLLERAGLTLADIPKDWGPFWSFWCDKVQPAVRKATGRDDIYGVGLAMSAAAEDTAYQFWQFVSAYEADYVTRDGRLVIDRARGPEPARRGARRLHRALPQGLRPARRGRLGRRRQQPGLPGADGRR